MCEPLRNDITNEKFVFLNKFLIWLQKWDDIKSITGKLTKETYTALNHTTHSILQLTDYCIKELGLKYILPGKIQTDALEARFGQYCLLAGVQYHVSIRKIFEIEAKLRYSSVMKLELCSHANGSIHVDSFEDCESEVEHHEINNNIFNEITVADDDIESVKEQLPIITYLAGYCVYSVLKRMSCDICKDYLVLNKAFCVNENFKLIQNTDRGGLLFPTQPVINAVLHNYLITQKLISEKYEREFIKVLNQRYLVSRLTWNIVVMNDLFWDLGICSNGHSLKKILEIILKTSTNTLLKNYCKLKNCNSKTQHFRKLNTFK